MTPEQEFHKNIKELTREAEEINKQLRAALLQLRGYLMPEPVEQELPELTEIIEKREA